MKSILYAAPTQELAFLMASKHFPYATFDKTARTYIQDNYRIIVRPIGYNVMGLKFDRCYVLPSQDQASNRDYAKWIIQLESRLNKGGRISFL